jgi:flagellar motility protein MotE (MotC chaperone)
MIRMARDFRLIPIVLLATICLFVLKVSGIVFDGGYTLAERLQGRDKSDLVVTSADSVPDYPKIVIADEGTALDRPGANVPWSQAMFNYNGSAKGNEPARLAAKADVTGSVNAGANNAAAKPNATDDITYSSGHGDSEKKAEGAADAGPPLKTSEKPPEPTKLDVGGEPQPLAPQGKINSPGERAILGRLQDRRQELDERNRELDMRESLLKAAEKRLDAKVNELKDIEARIKVASNARDEAEVQRFKGIVSMYENMKPKDAARIFDRLEMRVLAEVATAIKSRTMSEILAQMSPDSAEKLTVELANRANAQAKPASAGELPKIDGKPRS